MKGAGRDQGEGPERVTTARAAVEAGAASLLSLKSTRPQRLLHP